MIELCRVISGGFMQSVDLSRDLSFAVEAMEEILNSRDGDAFLHSIRQYIQTKEIDDTALLRLKQYLG